MERSSPAQCALGIFLSNTATQHIYLTGFFLLPCRKRRAA